MIDINNIKQLCRERGTTMTVIARRMYPDDLPNWSAVAVADENGNGNEKA